MNERPGSPSAAARVVVRIAIAFAGLVLGAVAGLVVAACAGWIHIAC